MAATGLLGGQETVYVAREDRKRVSVYLEVRIRASYELLKAYDGRLKV
jgi:hypothetical protein